MHMELFYHYTQVTSHTLAFATGGAEVVQISFHVSFAIPSFPPFSFPKPPYGIILDRGRRSRYTDLTCPASRRNTS